jgi:hypothetical protein
MPFFKDLFGKLGGKQIADPAPLDADTGPSAGNSGPNNAPGPDDTPSAWLRTPQLNTDGAPALPPLDQATGGLEQPGRVEYPNITFYVPEVDQQDEAPSYFDAQSAPTTGDNSHPDFAWLPTSAPQGGQDDKDLADGGDAASDDRFNGKYLVQGVVHNAPPDDVAHELAHTSQASPSAEPSHKIPEYHKVWEDGALNAQPQDTVGALDELDPIGTHVERGPDPNPEPEAGAQNDMRFMRSRSGHMLDDAEEPDGLASPDDDDAAIGHVTKVDAFTFKQKVTENSLGSERLVGTETEAEDTESHATLADLHHESAGIVPLDEHHDVDPGQLDDALEHLHGIDD